VTNLSYQLTNQSYFINMFFGETFLTTATGFFFKYKDKPYFITNYHVATGRKPENGKTIDKNCAIPNKMCIFTPETNNTIFEWIWVEDKPEEFWVLPNNKLDIAIKEINNTEILDNIEWVDLFAGKEWEVSITEKIVVVGYPYGDRVSTRTPCCITGYVATDIDTDFNDLPLFLVDSRTREGMSGSPVYYYVTTGLGINKFDESMDFGFGDKSHPLIQKFLGIYSGRIDKESDLGKVWKVQAITDLLRSSSLKKNLK